MDYIQKAIEESYQIFLKKLPNETNRFNIFLIIPSQQKLLLIKNSTWFYRNI